MGKFDKKRKTRKVKDTILIVCGGETEKLYFKYLNQKYKDKTSKVRLCIKTESKDPYKIVEFAIKCRDAKEKDRINDTWVVFDKDDFEKEFYNALELAHENNIKCAYSNQAFELWFLQHFKYISGNLNRKRYKGEINKMLKNNLNTNITYSKKEKDLQAFFEIILEPKLIENAINNSKRSHQNKIQYNKEFEESTTTVYQLVDKLLK